jgi:flavin-binding protein dodecin
LQYLGELGRVRSVQLCLGHGCSSPSRSRTVSKSATPQECKELPCGTSPEGIERAVRNALRRAAQTIRHLDWFEVTQVRGQIVDGEIAHFQVGPKVGFRLEDG